MKLGIVGNTVAYFRRKVVKSFALSFENAQDKDDWRLRIKWATGLSVKWPLRWRVGVNTLNNQHRLCAIRNAD